MEQCDSFLSASSRTVFFGPIDKGLLWTRFFYRGRYISIRNELMNNGGGGTLDSCSIHRTVVWF